jgi:uncharacterized protein YjbI with pentapeptide repeats
MSRRTNVPRSPSIRLTDLEDGDDLDLRESTVEARRFTDVELSDTDLGGSTLSECDLDGLRAGELRLGGARLLESRIRRLDAPVLRGARSTWRDVVLDGGRIGSAELYDSGFTAVRISGCKLGFVNLRGATLTDVVFEDCRIDELDLGGARVRRAAFPGCRIGTLALQNAVLVDTDLRHVELSEITGVEGLRGATIDSDQLTLLAPLLARSAGLRIED